MNSPFHLPAETVIAFAIFAFVASITPGPNNAMVMTSGANFGFRRTIPHIAGVVLGFQLLLLAVGAGLGALFTAFPILQDILWFVGTAYLLWLAWKIASTKGMNSADNGRPMRFSEIVAFQWVNPKAWVGAIGAFGAYVPKDNFLGGAAMILIIFFVMTLLAVALWTAGGVALSRLLREPGALRTFNLVMGIMLALSLIPSAIERFMPPLRLF